MDIRGYLTNYLNKDKDDELRQSLYKQYQAKVPLKTDVSPSLGEGLRSALKIAAMEPPRITQQDVAGGVRNALASGIARQRSALDLNKQRFSGTPITPFQRKQYVGQSLNTLGTQAKGVGRAYLGGARVGTMAVGATNPLALGAYTALGTGINYLGNRASGVEGPASLKLGFIQSVENLPRSAAMVGVNKFTQPVMDARAARILKLSPGLRGQLKGRAAMSLMNVGEGLIMDRASGYKTTPQSVALDAITGATVFAGPANEPIKRSIGRLSRGIADSAQGGFARIGRPEVYSPISINPEDTPLLMEMVRDGRAGLDTYTGLVKEFEDGSWVNIGRLPKSTVEYMKFNDQIARPLNIGGEAGFFDPNARIEFTQSDLDYAITKGVIAEDEAKGFKSSMNNILNPLKNAPEDAQNIVGNWNKGVLEGKIKANMDGYRFKDIPEKDAWKIVQYMQEPIPENAVRLQLDVEKYAEDIANIRNTFDSMRKEYVDRGGDVGYLNDYIMQVWKQSPEQVQRVLSASKNPKFSKERVIPTYREGMEMGLTPKYTHIAQLISEYRMAMEKALANKKLVSDLIGAGYLVPSNKAPADWDFINMKGVPPARVRAGGDVIDLNYKASKPIADSLNNIFNRNTNDMLSTAANISRYMQNITLSGGVPKTPINAFTLGLGVKEISSGRVKSPVAAFLRSFSKSWSDKFEAENVGYRQLMAQEGIPSRTGSDYQKLFKNLADSKTFKEVLGDKWDEYLQEPTFNRFLPQLELQFFKDIYEGALKNGADPIEARSLAGSSTRNFYGIVDTLGRSANTEEALTAVFFAPRFRESMINFWKNNWDAIRPKNWTEAEFKANRKFLVGTALTYLFMSVLNKGFTGHWSHENKGGKELALEIPVGNGRSWFIPLLPSVGTVPRRLVEAGGAFIGGDPRTGTQKATSFLSQPIQLGSQLLTDRTFYGGSITKESDPRLAKTAKRIGYALEQSSHPFFGEPIAVLQGRKTPIEAALGMLELPIYPSKSTPRKWKYKISSGGGAKTGGTGGSMVPSTTQVETNVLRPSGRVLLPKGR